MERISKVMDRTNKPFDPIATLFIIYLALIAVAIALYALIKVFADEIDLASSLLGWTATLFATIALLYTYNSWRKQKASDVIANEAKIIIDAMNSQIDTHRSLVWSKCYDDSYKSHLNNLEYDYSFIERRISLLSKLIMSEHSEQNFKIFEDKKKSYLSSYISFKHALSTDYLLGSNNIKDPVITDTNNTELIAEKYASGHLDMYEILIKICLHHNDF